MRNKQVVKKIPQLRFSEFGGEWEEKRLGDIAKFWNGKAHEQNIVKSGFVVVNSKFVSSDGKVRKFANKQISVLKKDDIVIVMSDIPNGKAISKCFLINQDDRYTLNQRIGGIRSNRITSLFLIRIINRNKYFLKFDNGVSQTNLRKDEILHCPVIFPGNKEQQKIASFLTLVDNWIENLEKQKDLLEEYKKGVMQKIFSQEIRFKDDGVSKFSEWEYKKGNLIFETISNKNHNSDLPILAISQEFGAIPREMIDYQITVSQNSVSSYKVIEIGDFIISLRSFQGGIEYSKYKGICSPAYIILRSFIEIDNNFFRFYFKTQQYIQQLNSKLEGIRDGKMISYKYFSEIKLPFPSLKEQAKIANFLFPVDKLIESKDNQIAKVKEWKKGLLQRMFV